MPLSSANLLAQLSFALSRSNTGFGNTVLQSSSIPFTLASLDTSTFNEVYPVQTTLAAAASLTLDLTSLTNQIESFSFGHVLTLMVTASGSQCTVSPGASNPLQWFFGGTTQSIVIPDNGMFCYSEPVAGPGAVVDSSHKTLKFTNSGAGTLTLTLGILGSTT